MVGDHYEVKVDGVWTPVPYDKINNVVAPDGGAHVCAPRQVGPNEGVIFCVILPSEGRPSWMKAVADHHASRRGTNFLEDSEFKTWPALMPRPRCV
jgi:hypothetical protein